MTTKDHETSAQDGSSNDGHDTTAQDGSSNDDHDTTAQDGSSNDGHGDHDDRTEPTPESSGSLSRRALVRTGAVAGASALVSGAVLGDSGAVLSGKQSDRPTPAVVADVAKESCEDWATFEVGDGNWQLMNNKWGMPDSEQCIRVFEDGSYGHEFTAVGDGINYPEVFCGSRPWGSSTGVPEFPIRRGDVEELVLEWDVDIDVDGGGWNLAEEWWLLDGEPDPEDPAIAHEIMLVLDWGADHDHYMEAEDVRRDRFGNQIDHWADYDHSQGWSFQIFRIAGGAPTGRVDFTEIIDYMTESDGVDEDLTMTGIEVGNEYWSGTSGQVRFRSCDLTVNGTTYESGVDDENPDTIEVGDYDVRDSNGDGRYNDFNGNGGTDFEDVSAFAENLDDEAVQNNPDAFDFADTDRVGFADVLELLRRV